MHVALCNWLVPVASPTGLCLSCSLTRTRPADHDPAALPQFGEAEVAKRRLVFELTELGLPITGRDVDPESRAVLRPAVQRARPRHRPATTTA